MFWSRKQPAETVKYPEPWAVWRRGNTEPSAMSDSVLLARVAEAVAWCDSLSETDVKRADALAPPLFHEGPDDLMCHIGSTRQMLLRDRKLQVARVAQGAPVVAAGRFMLYFPDENLSCGTAAQVSGGFFDLENVPACNTWVSFFHEAARGDSHASRYLLCYVPALAVAAADAGIDHNPEECIMWLDQTRVPIRRRVEAVINRS